MKSRRLMVKVNRISAWMLLIFMIIFLISGYAWTERILMPLSLARRMHTQLDVYLVFFFLVHILTSTKFTLARWHVPHQRAQDLGLLIIGFVSFALVLRI